MLLALLTAPLRAQDDWTRFRGPNGTGVSTATNLPAEFGPGWFRWQGRTFARPEDGLVLAFPNPWNPQRTVTLLAANSGLQLYHMTRSAPRGWQAWARFKGAEIAEKGYHPPKGATIAF